MIITALCSLLHAAQEPVSVTLSGTVKDGEGKPMTGVTVTLAAMNSLSTESDSDGVFTLTDVTGVIHPENFTRTSEFTIKNNTVIFSTVSEKITGKMSLYSGNGRLITSVSLDNLHAGQRQVALPELSAGIYLLSGSVCGASFTRSLVCVGNNLYLKNETTEVRGNNRSQTLRKSTAATIVDTLIASKEGFDTTRLPVDSYTKDGIEIVMAEEGGGEFTITSTAFDDGDEMPDEYTCEGKAITGSIAPPLEWSGIPEGAKSLALFFKDLTFAGQGNSMGFHWGMWNIPITITGMPKALGGDAKPSEMGGAEQKSAMFNSNKFFGPCPSGDLHTYAFVLYAFDTEAITPPTDLMAMDKYFEDHAIAQTTISVTSDAKSSGGGF